MDGEGLRYVAPELSRSSFLGLTFPRYVSLGAKSLPTFWATFGGVRVCFRRDPGALHVFGTLCLRHLGFRLCFSRFTTDYVL